MVYWRLLSAEIAPIKRRCMEFLEQRANIGLRFIHFTLAHFAVVRVDSEVGWRQSEEQSLVVIIVITSVHLCEISSRTTGTTFLFEGLHGSCFGFFGENEKFLNN